MSDDDPKIAKSVVSQATNIHRPSDQGHNGFPDDLESTLSPVAVPSSEVRVATPITEPYQLPAPSPMATPTFVWGDRDSETFMH